MNADTEKLANPTSEFDMETPGRNLSTLILFPVYDAQAYKLLIQMALNLNLGPVSPSRKSQGSRPCCPMAYISG